MNIFHVMFVVAFAGIAAAVRHALTRGRAAAPSAETEAPSALALAPCVHCGSVASHQTPTIVERRGIVDPAWVDALARRIGARREVQYALVLERPIEHPYTHCATCHRVARAECERYLQRLSVARADARVEEARGVADFLAFGLADAMLAHLAEQVTRAKRAGSRLRTSATVAAVPRVAGGDA